LRNNETRDNAFKDPELLPSGSMNHSGNVRVGIKFLVCLALSVCAFGDRRTSVLIVLTGMNLLLVAGNSFSFRAIKSGFTFFTSQTIIIVVLYLIRFQTIDALWSGFKISWQLFLAFLPGFIFVETTPQPRIVMALSYVLPPMTAFVMATCLKFLPMLMDDIRTIYEGQIMRGARIRPQDILRPWNWPDVIHCLVVPSIIQSLKLSGDIALAAKARDFGVSSKRTCWPGD
jgi:energy-coupling factor transport system permease protein